MEYLPIFIDLKDKNVLVIGDYRILEFKIMKLIEARAKIFFLTTLLTDQIENLDKSERVVFIRDQFNESYLDDKWLVICGSEDKELKKKIARATSERNIFCNFVDQAPISSFISPAVISRGDITIALSTKGKSPALIKYLKNQIMKVIGDEYGEFAKILGKMRKKVIENIPGQNRRSDIFDSIVQDPDVLKLIQGGNYLKAEELIEKIIDNEIRN
jgi:siroheme synthase-like protein